MADRRTIVMRSFRDYQRADRKTKGQILDRVMKQTLYRSRAYLALILRQWGKVGWEAGPRGPLRLVAGAPRPTRRASKPTYGESVRQALIRLWYLCDCMCGKRLVAAIRSLLVVYERCGELKVSSSVRGKLLSLSAATADRLLKPERSKVRTGRGRSYTRSNATRLLHQIPLRTFDEWDRSILGQVQADLVAHDGGHSGSISGGAVRPRAWAVPRSPESAPIRDGLREGTVLVTEGGDPFRGQWFGRPVLRGFAESLRPSLRDCPLIGDA